MRIEEYIPKRLEELCDERGISKYRLAQETGIRDTTLTRIFTQKSIPTIYTLDKIWNIFSVQRTIHLTVIFRKKLFIHGIDWV